MSKLRKEIWKENQTQRKERIANTLGAGINLRSKTWGGKKNVKQSRQDWRKQQKTF